jgi:signal peptidase II
VCERNIMIAFLKKHSVFITITLFCFFIDRLTKHLAVLFLKGRRSVSIVDNFLDLTYVENKGAAFGLFSNIDSMFRIPFLTLVALLALIFIVYIYLKLSQEERMTRLSLSFVLGGAIGNIYDRFLHGYVVDFIDVHYYRLFTWPTFNFADIVISIGAGLIVLSLIIGGLKEGNRSQKGEI